MEPKRIWYLVMNSNRARILRGLPLPHVAADAELALQSGRQKLRDFLNGHPTCSYSSSPPDHRSAIHLASDPVREDTIRFIRDVLDFLTAQRKADAFDELVVVAPDDTLGLWRDEVSAPVAETIRGEVAKNYVRLTPVELGTAIRHQLEEQGICLYPSQPIGWTSVGY